MEQFFLVYPVTHWQACMAPERSLDKQVSLFWHGADWHGSTPKHKQGGRTTSDLARSLLSVDYKERVPWKNNIQKQADQAISTFEKSRSRKKMAYRFSKFNAHCLLSYRERSYACLYTRGWGTMPMRQHNILTRKNSHKLCVCSGRDSNLWSWNPLISTPTLYQLSHHVPHIQTSISICGIHRSSVMSSLNVIAEILSELKSYEVWDWHWGAWWLNW